jgi:hypothetical protein
MRAARRTGITNASMATTTSAAALSRTGRPDRRQFRRLSRFEIRLSPSFLLYEILGCSVFPGAIMPRYLTQHTLACLTRQGAEALAQRMQAGGTAHAERVLVNMLEGKMFVEFRAESREALEGWLRTEGMHFDWLVRIEWEMQGEKLQLAD